MDKVDRGDLSIHKTSRVSERGGRKKTMGWLIGETSFGTEAFHLVENTDN